jgi:transcriptional regulator with XRE-family HTH domain
MKDTTRLPRTFANIGEPLKLWRTKVGLTQRQVANEVGVKPSYVAYLEAGQRQPSLPLAIRIADLMGVDRTTLCCVGRPELVEILTAQAKPAHSPKKSEWSRFVTQVALLRRHRITDSELRVLKEVSNLGNIKPRHLLSVLNSIRQALEADGE